MSEKVTVIDGGFSTQLSHHVGSNIDGDPLWSARFNAVEPSAVIQSHLDFLENGAEIILTNTYQASVEGYTEHLKLDRAQSIDLIKSTVQLAQIARDKFIQTNAGQPTPRIFASIGPYGAHLHDGSEYTGSYATNVTPATIKKWHKVRIDACVEAGVDGLAIETIPCLVSRSFTSKFPFQLKLLVLDGSRGGC
jgi:homocysteine S-methyltransferase